MDPLVQSAIATGLLGGIFGLMAPGPPKPEMQPVAVGGNPAQWLQAAQGMSRRGGGQYAQTQPVQVDWGTGAGQPDPRLMAQKQAIERLKRGLV